MKRAILLGLLAAGCGKGDSGGSAGSNGSGAAMGSTGAGGSAAAAPAKGPREALLDAWRAGGLTPSAFTPSAPSPMGKDCTAGTVNGVEVKLCLFGAPAEAKAAEDPALGWVGQATGAAQAHGVVLIAVADRHKADPTGRTINQLFKLAR
jgi:hypothetical protein